MIYFVWLISSPRYIYIHTVSRFVETLVNIVLNNVFTCWNFKIADRKS